MIITYLYDFDLRQLNNGILVEAELIFNEPFVNNSIDEDSVRLTGRWPHKMAFYKETYYCKYPGRVGSLSICMDDIVHGMQIYLIHVTLYGLCCDIKFAVIQAYAPNHYPSRTL